MPAETNQLADLAWLCAFPLGGAALVVGFMLVTAMVHATARVLGGCGSYTQLAFVLGALAAPFSILTALLLPFNLIPYAGLCFGFFTMLIALYLLGLQVPAIRGVHRLGWGRALAALILPALVLSPLAVCIVVTYKP